MKIIREPIKNQVYNIIKNRILNFEYNFGDPINITALTKELDVSNTPVREALSRLEAEGLVISSYSSHVRVIELTEELIKEINEAVLSLELGAYDFNLLTGKEESLIATLQSALDRQEQNLTTDTSQDFIRSAIAFDKGFVQATENSRLISTFESLEPILYMLTNYNYHQQQVNKKNNLLEHKRILTAVKKAGELSDKMAVHKLLAQHYDKHIAENACLHTTGNPEI